MHRASQELLEQWNECFGGPATGSFASPAALAADLMAEKEANAKLRRELNEARGAAALVERRCLESLRQHHAAHAEEREREASRHAEEVARLREIQGSLLARAQQPAAQQAAR